MSANERLMVAAAIHEAQPGEEFAKLPPHLTFFPWFDLPSDNWPQFDAGMKDVILENRQPTVKGGSHVLYGPDETKSARRLDRYTPTFNAIIGYGIFAEIYQLAHIYGIPKDVTYSGLDWNPHITDTEAFKLGAEEELQLTNLTVFAKDVVRGRKIAKAIYKWGY